MSSIRIYQTYMNIPGEGEETQTIETSSISPVSIVSSPAVVLGEAPELDILPSSIYISFSISSPTVSIIAEQEIQTNSIDDVSSVGEPYIVSYAPYLGYRVTFTATDTHSTGTDELTYTVRTAPSGGNIVYSGTATAGIEEESDLIDDPYLEVGTNSRYIRVVDGGGNTVTSAEFFVVLQPPEKFILSPGIPSVSAIGESTEVYNGRLGVSSIPSSLTFGTHEVEPGFIPEKEPFSIHRYFAGLYGPVSYSVGLRYYTEEGILVGDAKEFLVSLSLDWDMSRAVQRTLSCTLEDNTDAVLQQYILEPYAIAQVYNPNINQVIPQEFLFGQYIQANPKKSIGTSTRKMITGYDMTNRLVEKTIEDQMIIAQGDNYGSRIRYLAIEAGFQDRNIVLPVTYETLPTPITFEPGKSYYEIITLLAEAVNWSKPFMTNDNKLQIIENSDLTMRQKTRVFATDNTSSILPNVEYEMDMRKVINKVIININDPLRTPETVSYINDNLENPYSRSVSGKTVTEIIDGLDHLATTEIAEERAKFETQLFSSNQSIELKTLPNFTLSPHEVYSLVILDQETQEPIIYSDWFAESWKINMETGAETTIQLRNILPV